MSALVTPATPLLEDEEPVVTKPLKPIPIVAPEAIEDDEPLLPAKPIKAPVLPADDDVPAKPIKTPVLPVDDEVPAGVVPPAVSGPTRAPLIASEGTGCNFSTMTDAESQCRREKAAWVAKYMAPIVLGVGAFILILVFCAYKWRKRAKANKKAASDARLIAAAGGRATSV